LSDPRLSRDLCLLPLLGGSLQIHTSMAPAQIIVSPSNRSISILTGTPAFITTPAKGGQFVDRSQEVWGITQSSIGPSSVPTDARCQMPNACCLKTKRTSKVTFSKSGVLLRNTQCHMIRDATKQVSCTRRSRLLFLKEARISDPCLPPRFRLRWLRRCSD
jgi:hypothetical protein